MSWAVAPGVDFNGQASLGRTQLQGGFLQTAGPATSSAWRMSLDGNCKVFGLACTAVHLSLSQPLRIERGEFSAVLPDAPQSADDPLTFSERRFDAAPTGREVDLRLTGRARLGALGRGEPAGVVSREPGNIEAAPPAAGVAFGWRTQF
ncbi:MAG: hypothetical protein WDN45_01450 [Caulobacteraceae bacterium]